MPKSITQVLLDRQPEGDAPPLRRFKNHGDFMRANAAPTVKPPHRQKFADLNNRICAADKIRPRDA